MFSGGTREKIITVPLVLGIMAAFGVMALRVYAELVQ